MVKYLSFHNSSFGLKWQDGAKNGNRGTTISDVNHISCSTLWNIKVMGLGQGYSSSFFKLVIWNIWRIFPQKISKTSQIYTLKKIICPQISQFFVRKNQWSKAGFCFYFIFPNSSSRCTGEKNPWH
jgi:hypothetical protein